MGHGTPGVLLPPVLLPDRQLLQAVRYVLAVHAHVEGINAAGLPQHLLDGPYGRLQLHSVLGLVAPIAGHRHNVAGVLLPEPHAVDRQRAPALRPHDPRVHHHRAAGVLARSLSGGPRCSSGCNVPAALRRDRGLRLHETQLDGPLRQLLDGLLPLPQLHVPQRDLAVGRPHEVVQPLPHFDVGNRLPALPLPPVLPPCVQLLDVLDDVDRVRADLEVRRGVGGRHREHREQLHLVLGLHRVVGEPHNVARVFGPEPDAVHGLGALALGPDHAAVRHRGLGGRGGQRGDGVREQCGGEE
mmetsp:Transcript_40038/g.66683  ORF Transcript_40038/g.66683 Transcript_40038/m.66683 type:complete len:299 (+) Transcript_40038:4316-5212(+)